MSGYKQFRRDSARLVQVLGWPPLGGAGSLGTAEASLNWRLPGSPNCPMIPATRALAMRVTSGIDDEPVGIVDTLYPAAPDEIFGNADRYTDFLFTL